MSDAKARTRIVKLLLRILSNPYRFKRKDLAAHFEVDISTIKKDINILKNISELEFKQDRSNWTCAILPDSSFKELQYLQALTTEERSRIAALINERISGKEALYLNRKLEKLYDFQKLGLRALRRPALERIDQLEAARKQKRIAVLENYRSNSSNEIKNRLVEPFHIDPELDTLQAFDHSRKDSIHFRLSRIERVRLTADNWQFEHRHYFKHTDVFRIANNNQVYVHLRLTVFAYNILREQFPMANTYLQPSNEVGYYDFETKVNAKFLGLINFILGYAPYLEVIEPESLKALVRAKTKAILEQYE